MKNHYKINSMKTRYEIKSKYIWMNIFSIAYSAEEIL